MINPIGEQIIIQCIQPESVGSIIIPDSVKAITKTGESSLVDQLNFVEANVIACGPGKRGKDETLVADMADLLRLFIDPESDVMVPYDSVRQLLARAEDPNARQPLIVKAGDRILFHPSVQRFDREIEPESIGLPANSGRCFIIREDSVLGIIESAPQPASAGAALSA